MRRTRAEIEELRMAYERRADEYAELRSRVAVSLEGVNTAYRVWQQALKESFEPDEGSGKQ